MEEKEMKEFSWLTLFFVTGTSFILFSFALKFLDGRHSVPMLWVGGIAFVSGTFGWLGKIFSKPTVKKKGNLAS
ncbi:MAG: hypothetical protein JNK27_11745 [Chitinophagaceae bacterium]|nr:hypothetical protein [Chitinophagaceae bacterium]